MSIGVAVTLEAPANMANRDRVGALRFAHPTYTVSVSCQFKPLRVDSIQDTPKPIQGEAAIKRSIQILLAVAGLALCASASAQIKLVNKDSKAHDVLIKCSSSADSSIAGSSTRDIGKGPCTVTVKSTKSSRSASGKGELTIKNGKFN